MTRLLSLALCATAFTPFAGIAAIDPSEIVPTVEIKLGNGTARINRSDFNPAVHELANPADLEDPAPVAAAPDPAFAAPSEPAPSPAAAIPPAPGAAAPTTPPVTAPAAIPPAPGGAAPATPPASPAAPVEKFVMKIDKKFFITDATGKPLDPTSTGYKTEAEAQAAIQ